MLIHFGWNISWLFINGGKFSLLMQQVSILHFGLIFVLSDLEIAWNSDFFFQSTNRIKKYELRTREASNCLLYIKNW